MRLRAHHDRESKTTYCFDVETQWTLRYAPDQLDRTDQLVAASIMAQWSTITDPVYTQAQAIAMLKRARKARRLLPPLP